MYSIGLHGLLCSLTIEYSASASVSSAPTCRKRAFARIDVQKLLEFCSRLPREQAGIPDVPIMRSAQKSGLLHALHGTPGFGAKLKRLTPNSLQRGRRNVLVQNPKNPERRRLLHMRPQHQRANPQCTCASPEPSPRLPALSFSMGHLSAKAASKANALGSKSSFFTNSHASRAPCSRS